jgi:hypothetical protein
VPRGRSPDRAGRQHPARSPGSMADPPRGRRVGRTRPPTYEERHRRCRRYGCAYNHPGRWGTGRPGWLCQCRYAAQCAGLVTSPG